LTGGIAAGKSTALAALERLGAATASSDAVVHSLYATDAEVLAAVVGRWGDEVAPGGVVDRGALAGRAFATEEDRAWLEGMLWPRVRARVAQWRERESLRDPAPRALVIEIPLLFESGQGQGFDATISVIASDRMRSERAAAQGMQAFAQREARQLSQAEKAARSTYVVQNDGDIAQLESKLSAILDKLAG
jgi:dephospho-CoA kinase